MLMSVAAATGPSLRRIAGTSSATSECVQVAAVGSALSGGARPSVSGTWTYSLGRGRVRLREVGVREALGV
eukprot:2522804-Prymnesium_polylepis.1